MTEQATKDSINMNCRGRPCLEAATRYRDRPSAIWVMNNIWISDANTTVQSLAAMIIIKHKVTLVYDLHKSHHNVTLSKGYLICTDSGDLKLQGFSV